MRSTLTLKLDQGSGCLRDYRIQSRPLRQEDIAKGQPGLRYGRDIRGRHVLIKSWSLSGGVNLDLRSLWQEDIRFLRLLCAERDRQSLLMKILDATADDSGFHLILSTESRRVLGDAPPPISAGAPSSSNEISRRKFWRNVYRLVKGVRFLHGQGVAHRNIDLWSIASAGSGLVDFQLTGHEWSSRCLEVSNQSIEIASEHCDTAMDRDWRALGGLIEKLFEREGVSPSLEKQEVQLLKLMKLPAVPNPREIERFSAELAQLDSNSSHSSPPAHALTLRANNASNEALGFLLLQLLQSISSAATEFPVEIVQTPRSLFRSHRRAYRVCLRSRPDNQRDRLLQLVSGRGRLHEMLRAALVDRDFLETDVWEFTDTLRRDGRGRSDHTWILSFDAPLSSDDSVYVFECEEPMSEARHGVLCGGSGGRSVHQFRRQLKAWRALVTHLELQERLRDCAAVVEPTAFSISDDDRFSKLDLPKRQALQGILTSKPLSVVHGPPGVGKTRLVTELCRQVLNANPSAKLVLSAQSHAAVDNLAAEIAKLNLPSHLAVRCRAADASRPLTDLDLPVQTRSLLESVSRSKWFSHCSVSVRDTVSGLCSSAKDRRHVPRFEQRPIEALLLRSARIVLGTANCATFENLRDEGIQYDWSIVEEAAKATGNELLASLLLAQRQLLIGDHLQLPPFLADELNRLLTLPERVVELLKVATEMQLDEMDEEESQSLLRAMEKDRTDAEKICVSAQEALSLFRCLVERNMNSGPEGSTPVAHLLSEQHRMHPAIARVVSRAFYAGKLHVSRDCDSFFERNEPPVTTRDPVVLPNLPIVWVEMPWVQEHFGLRRAELRPGPYNPAEARAVLRTVLNIEPSTNDGKRPTLAILTPYRKQLATIERSLNSAPALVSHLSRFDKIGSTYLHTVDSFQGNEADVIVVSLVRNNDRASLTGALGFLKDLRRMNVLFSRAKWRLIVIGSQRFMRQTVERVSSGPEAADVTFLKELFSELDRAEQQGHARVISVSALTA